MLYNLDKLAFIFLNKTLGTNPILDQLWIFCASYLPWVLVLGLLAYIFFAPNRGRAFLRTLIFLGSAILAWLVSSMIKYGFYSPRPYQVLRGVSELLLVQGGDAFPSGHATFFGALATAVWYREKNRWGYLYVAGALLICLGRIVTGVHWPLDILAGLLLGWAVSTLIHRLLQYMKKTA